MRLQQIADSLDLVCQGEPNQNITGLAPVWAALPEHLTFVVSPKYLALLKSTQAGAVIVPESMVSAAPCSVLVSANPYLSYAEATQLLYPEAPFLPGISGNSVVADDVIIAESAGVAMHAVIEEGTRIGAGSWIGPGCVIGQGVTVGERCRVLANVTIYAGSVIGNDCRIQSGAVIGSDGFGFARYKDGWKRIHQVGRVVIGNSVEIGANTTIDRGALEDTVIGDGVILDNQIQIAHNVRIGRYTAIAACVGIAGSTSIGENCTIGGKTAIVGHITIADNVHLTATSFVTQSITLAGSYSSGMPLQPSRQWRRTYARLTKLDDLFRSLKKFRG